MGTPLELDEVWLERIKQNVEGLEYGCVQIIVHDGRIVQIERTERKRYDGESAGNSSADRANGPRAKNAEKPGSGGLTFPRHEGINENRRVSK